MKQLTLFCLLSVTFFCGYAQTARHTQLFNSDWKFHLGDIDHGESVDLADQDWRSLNLPHDWSIEATFNEELASATAYLPGGIGWYRKTFSAPSGIKNKKLYIYFDGVYKNSEVWINGHYLGKRPSGFVSFQYELTPYLNSGGKNVLAVRVDHAQFADSRWYTGSGIYRNVYLVSTSPLHIGLWGVQFTTPEVSAEKAAMNVHVSLLNESPKNAKVTINCKLAGPDGKTIAGSNKNIDLGASDSAMANLSFTLQSPQLWSVDRPTLYDLIVTLSADGRQTDEWHEKVGIRSIKFDADKGFFLNGKNMKLKGVCLHDDAGVFGVAVPEAVWYRRLKLLKEAGCNALRLSHNPHADYLYRLCDSLGLLVMDEAFDEWEFGKNKWIKGWNVGTPGKDGYHEFFIEWAARDLGDMVLRDRNHPSIIMWSIGNEIDYPNDPYSDSILNTGRNPQIYGKGYLPDHPPASRLGEISKVLVEVVKQHDSSRPVTAALAGVVMSNKTSFPENLDVVGYNYQEYRYQDDHAAYPTRIIYGSENGMQLSAWNAVDSNEYIAGQYLWTGIDYLGEARHWPSRSSGSGLLDLAGFPKPAYYFRQSLWSDRPMIYMTRSPITDSTKSGAKIRVTCFTNCEEAELFLNGRSLGKQRLAQSPNRVLNWDADDQPGELIVKGYAKNGKIVSYRIRTAGEPYALATGTDIPSETSSGLLASGSSPGLLPANTPSGLLQLVIQIVDKNGVPVPTAENEITVRIDGPAKLLGLESGSLTSHENYQSNSRRALNGKLMAYIQPVGKPGIIRIIIQSKGLLSTPLQLPLSSSHL